MSPDSIDKVASQLTDCPDHVSFTGLPASWYNTLSELVSQFIWVIKWFSWFGFWGVSISLGLELTGRRSRIAGWNCYKWQNHGVFVVYVLKDVQVKPSISPPSALCVTPSRLQLSCVLQHTRGSAALWLMTFKSLHHSSISLGSGTKKCVGMKSNVFLLFFLNHLQ